MQEAFAVALRRWPLDGLPPNPGGWITTTARKRAIGDFFGSVPQGGRLNEIRLVPTSANRQPALAAYSRGDDGKHRPYGLMVLQVEDDRIAGILGFPDPWLFERCGLPSELT